MVTFETQKDFEAAVKTYLLNSLHLQLFYTQTRDSVGTKVVCGAALSVDGDEVYWNYDE